MHLHSFTMCTHNPESQRCTAHGGRGLELDDLEGLTQLQPICDMLFQQVIHVCERDLILTFFSFSKTENEMELLNAGMPPQAGIARIASGIRERVKTGSDYSKNDSL